MFKQLQRFLLQNLMVGLIILVPIVATVYAVVALLNFGDQLVFMLLPKSVRPDELVGFRIPGLGILITFLLIFGTGVLARYYLGKRVLAAVESGLSRVPVLRGFYFALRQFMESVFVDRKEAFRKVVAIEYPRKGLYTLAFVTGVSETLIRQAVPDEEVLTVFVPTTPNPTSGFLLLVPVSQTIDLPIRVDEAFRLIVSGGVLAGQRRDFLSRLGVEPPAHEPPAHEGAQP